MAEVSEEDIERLASRLAMMVSEEGEAANAGRAVAQLARRLGLTGGALKEMFLYGATGGGRAVLPAVPAHTDTERLEREIGTLRKGLRLMETNYRDLEYERDAMARELEALRARVEAARSSAQIRFVLIGVAVLAIAGAGAIGWLMAIGETGAPPAGPIAPPPQAMLAPPTVAGAATQETPDYGPVTRRVGVIKTGRAVAYRQPDRGAPAVATLQQGMPVVVRRVFYNRQTQWAEVEVGSSIGYVMTTDIDLA